MAKRQLTQEELVQMFRPILEGVRARLRDASGGDPQLRWGCGASSPRSSRTTSGARPCSD